MTAIRLLDPLEMKLPDMGLISLRDPETGQTQLVDCDGAFLKRFAKLADEQETRLREELARSGVDTLEISTGDDLADALIRFCAQRRRKSRRFAAPSALPSPAGRGSLSNPPFLQAEGRGEGSPHLAMA